jgi:hypothetical protein
MLELSERNRIRAGMSRADMRDITVVVGRTQHQAQSAPDAGE